MAEMMGAAGQVQVSPLQRNTMNVGQGIRLLPQQNQALQSQGFPARRDTFHHHPTAQGRSQKRGQETGRRGPQSPSQSQNQSDPNPKAQAGPATARRRPRRGDGLRGLAQGGRGVGGAWFFQRN